MNINNNNAVIPSPPDERDYPVSMVADISNVNIPADFEVWQPPVENQGSTGNCVAQSLANIMECIAHQYGEEHKDYSVGYIYGSPLNIASTGMFPRNACEIMLKQGDVLRAVWECKEENPNCSEIWEAEVTEEIKASAHKVMAYIRINTKQEMQAFMLKYNLPVMLIAQSSSFREGADGRHATVCYGWISEDTYKANPKKYNDASFIDTSDNGGFRIISEDEYEDLLFTNSWGTHIHHGGRGACRFNEMEEIWGIVPIDEGENIMRGVEHLHPQLQKICEEFVNKCKADGLNVKITDTLRTKEEQDKLYAQGRTAPGSIVTNVAYPNSAHNWGVAFDICRNEKGREYDDSDGFFAKCGEIGKSLGLFWGGDFKSFTDKPHFEWKRAMPNNSTKWLKEQYGTPEEFMKTWSDNMNKFTDIEKHWAKEDTEYLAKIGIVNGYDDGTVKPDQMITRGEVFALLARAIRYSESAK